MSKNGPSEHSKSARDMLYTRDDDRDELLELVRGIDERLGHSPDAATGSEGSGLCRVVAELKAESDYRLRQEADRLVRAARWRERAGLVSTLLGGLVVAAGVLWAIARFVVLSVNK